TGMSRAHALLSAAWLRFRRARGRRKRRSSVSPGRWPRRRRLRQPSRATSHRSATPAPRGTIAHGSRAICCCASITRARALRKRGCAPMADGGKRATGAVHEALPHDSAHKHVTGEALYVDDLPEPAGLLHAWILTSPRAHARIVSIDVSKVPNGAIVMTAADMNGRNDVGTIFAGERVLAEGIVEYIGQPVLAVAAASIAAARAAAQRAAVVYEDLPPVLTIEDA